MYHIYDIVSSYEWMETWADGRRDKQAVKGKEGRLNGLTGRQIDKQRVSKIDLKAVGQTGEMIEIDKQQTD